MVVKKDKCDMYTYIYIYNKYKICSDVEDVKVYNISTCRGVHKFGTMKLITLLFGPHIFWNMVYSWYAHSIFSYLHTCCRYSDKCSWGNVIQNIIISEYESLSLSEYYIHESCERVSNIVSFSWSMKIGAAKWCHPTGTDPNSQELSRT